MRVVVIGVGKLGRRVVAYIADKHDVVAIEENQERARDVGDEFPSVKMIQGDGDEPGVLQEAGVDRADVVVATTGHDEDNLVAALLAKYEYKVGRVIAACRNPRNRWLFNRSWGVDVMVDSAQVVARLIEEEATLSDVVTLLELHEGEFAVTAVRVAPDGPLIGKTIADLRLPEGCTTAAVLHETRVLPSSSDEPFVADDEIVLIMRQGASCDIDTITASLD